MMKYKFGRFGWTLITLCFAFAENTGRTVHEDRHLGNQHSPLHNVNMVLGNEEQEEIKKLSLTEQRKRLVDIVKKIDTNSDKYLTAEELTVWIQQVYRQYAFEDAKERFPEFDTNQDGVVSWDEYNMVVHEHLIDVDDSTVREDPEQESVRLLHLKEKKRFDFADADGVPGLTLAEFLAFTHPSEVDHMSDYAIEDVLDEYDKDNNGFISIDEFLGDLRVNAEDKPSQWELDETIRFKDLYDQDKDGELNREEQLRWVAPNSYGTAREEAVHLIEEIDQDGNGKLSESEILNNQHTFLNSEVTDYGRQLHVVHEEL